jgi:hypothetical protein
MKEAEKIVRMKSYTNEVSAYRILVFIRITNCQALIYFSVLISHICRFLLYANYAFSLGFCMSVWCEWVRVSERARDGNILGRDRILQMRNVICD